MRISSIICGLALVASSAVFAADTTKTMATNPSGATPPPTLSPPSPAPTFASDKEKVSYALGRSIGEHFRQQEIDISTDLFDLGMKDALDQKPSAMSDKDMQAVMEKFQNEQMAKAQARLEKQAKDNLAASNTFLDNNKKRKEITTTPSGLQYEIITPGTGASPKAEDTVKVHYRGQLINGTEFDSSYDRGQPVTFQVNGVIPGWSEALQKMQPGAKWKIYLPPDLAYGERGAGGLIGPNSALIFEVELLEVNPKKEATTTTSNTETTTTTK